MYKRMTVVSTVTSDLTMHKCQHSQNPRCLCLLKEMCRWVKQGDIHWLKLARARNMSTSVREARLHFGAGVMSAEISVPPHLYNGNNVLQCDRSSRLSCLSVAVLARLLEALTTHHTLQAPTAGTRA